jgi:acrylyl-CoA reductase (NADPH)
VARAILLEAPEGTGGPKASIANLADEELGEGDVTVDVAWSGVNYKDALALLGQGRIVRAYPFVPGIDLAGTVRESAAPDLAVGTEVVVTGFGMGERHFGGFAERARVRREWVVPAPPGRDGRFAMALGTAGLTAALALGRLERLGLDGREHPRLLVTGASGGVGSVAVALAAREGCSVVALTGKAEAASYLRELGAEEVIDRSELASGPAKPLEHEQWRFAIDTVGGPTLASVLAGLTYGGAVASIGLAQSSRLETTVLPFILRGVSLLGIDSVYAPVPERLVAWERLASVLDASVVESMVTEIPLAEVPRRAADVLGGAVRGRLLVNTTA